MPYQIEWDNDEHTVIRTEMYGKWTWEEYHQLIDESVQLMKAVNHPVDLITLMRGDTVSPGGNFIPHIQRAMRAYPPNHRLTINVRAVRQGISLEKIFRQLFPWLNRRFFTVGTLEEARTIIKQSNQDGIKPGTISRR